MSFVYCSFGSADARKVHVRGDDFLSRKMTASLSENLIFDVETGNVGPDVLLDCQGNRIWSWIYYQQGEKWCCWMSRHTAVACIHVRDQRCAVRVKVGDHVRMSTHVTELCEAKVRLAKARSCSACTCLNDVNKLVCEVMI